MKWWILGSVGGLVVALAPLSAHADATGSVLSGQVISNNDGDTLSIRVGSKTVRVRLYGIDAPESRQEAGPAARDFTRGFTEGKSATVHVRDEDMYGRLVGEVFVGGRSLNRELARAGHGWWYRQYAGQDLDLRDLIDAARSARMGLWAADSPTPPWEWRRQHRDDLSGVRSFTDAEVEAAEEGLYGLRQPAPSDRTRLRAPAHAISPDLRGAELLAALRALCAPSSTLSYSAARTYMFRTLDNAAGSVRCVYTGVELHTSAIPPSSVMNTEHTWPQSRFAGSSRKGDIKSDLFHLYPSLSTVNAVRGNNPFAELVDTETDDWWRGAEPTASIPNTALDEYSESVVDSFEPREDHKGNVARSLLYVAVAYHDTGLPLDWLRPQLDTLLEWHVADPVDDAELARAAGISARQGNTNPLIDDPSLLPRVAEALR